MARSFSVPLYQPLGRPSVRLSHLTYTAKSYSFLAMSASSPIAGYRVTTTSSSASSSSLEVIGGLESLLSNLPSLHKPYKPFPVFAWNRHVETIFASFFRSLPAVRLRRECLRTPDDGSVALDWVAGDDRSLPPDSPVLILLPGLTGGSGDTYVQHMLVRARSKGWRVVVFNSRGCGDSPVTTPQFYSASFTEDLRHVVKHAGTRYPQSNLYAVGWSLGANILVRYLGQESDYCPLSGAVSLCNPFNLVIADEDFHKGFNIVYDKALARALCKIFKKHALLFEDMSGEYNIPKAADARSVREFDEGLTRVSFGFKSVDDYYLNSSSSLSIKDVRTPLLCIQALGNQHKRGCSKWDFSLQPTGLALTMHDEHLMSASDQQQQRLQLAANDPIAPSRGIPRDEIKENPHCLLVVTPEGGHLGWVAGDEAPFGAPWTDPLVMEFLDHLQNKKASAAMATQFDGTMQQVSEGLHKLAQA